MKSNVNFKLNKRELLTGLLMFLFVALKSVFIVPYYSIGLIANTTGLAKGVMTAIGIILILTFAALYVCMIFHFYKRSGFAGRFIAAIMLVDPIFVSTFNSVFSFVAAILIIVWIFLIEKFYRSQWIYLIFALFSFATVTAIPCSVFSFVPLALSVLFSFTITDNSGEKKSNNLITVAVAAFSSIAALLFAKSFLLGNTEHSEAYSALVGDKLHGFLLNNISDGFKGAINSNKNGIAVSFAAAWPVMIAVVFFMAWLVFCAYREKEYFKNELHKSKKTGSSKKVRNKPAENIKKQSKKKENEELISSRNSTLLKLLLTFIFLIIFTCFGSRYCADTFGVCTLITAPALMILIMLKEKEYYTCQAVDIFNKYIEKYRIVAVLLLIYLAVFSFRVNPSNDFFGSISRFFT
jgi:hypothetical protein